MGNREEEEGMKRRVSGRQGGGQEGEEENTAVSKIPSLLQTVQLFEALWNFLRSEGEQLPLLVSCRRCSSWATS